MELSKIIEILKEPEKIISPVQANLVSSYLSAYITDAEEKLNEENYSVSVKWRELRERMKTNTEADREIELTDIYRQREKTKLLIGNLKRLRGDVKDRFQVLTGQKRY